MKKYHIVESLFLSFYSKSLYQDVAREWKGLALGYLLLVMAICWLPFSYDFHRFLNQWSSQVLPEVVKQAPNITISKGKLSIDKPVPYALKEPGDGATLVMFDTSGKYTSVEQANALVLVTADNLIIRDRRVGKSTTYSHDSLTKGGEVKISKADFNYITDKVVFWMSVLMYPVSVFIAFVYRFLEALLLGGMGLLVAKFLHIPLDYRASVRLAIVALTPMLIVTTLMEYFSWPVSYVSVLSVILAVAYLLYAVYAQKLLASPQQAGGIES